MAPAATIDNRSDFHPISASATKTPLGERTLLLAPPSISSHEEKLRDVLSTHDRAYTDLQMLDRLAAGLIALPASTYNLVLLLTPADGSNNELRQLLSREVFTRIVQAMKAGGKLQSQDGRLGQDAQSSEYTEGVLAGLIASTTEGMIKPDYGATEAVPLRFGKKKDKTSVSDAGQTIATATTSANGKRKSVDISQNRKPAGVGFVDFNNHFNEPNITGQDFSNNFNEPNITGQDDDDELIDEDTLLTEEDLKRPVVVPPECVPRVGKRRRACRDCTCGLAERIAAEDAAKRATADAQIETLKLGADDLTEVDFTVQGKVGSCGNCSLGDAFRCSGCPYLGLPAFANLGGEVRLLNNDVQL